MESRDIMSNYICWLGLGRAVEQNSVNKVPMHFYGSWNRSGTAVGKLALK